MPFKNSLVIFWVLPGKFEEIEVNSKYHFSHLLISGKFIMENPQAFFFFFFFFFLQEKMQFTKMVNLTKDMNQSTDSTSGSIVSECRLGKWAWMRTRPFPSTLNFLLFKQTMQTLITLHILWHLIWVCTVCQCPKCPRPGFTDKPLAIVLWCHRDKYKVVTNNLSWILSFTLVSDNHMENVILAFVYYGLIVNNRPKNSYLDI